jgi:hypothetical protein
MDHQMALTPKGAFESINTPENIHMAAEITTQNPYKEHQNPLFA